MTPAELRSSFSLSSIFALRMLGLFLVLPVFALEASRYPGGDDPARVGLAMGIYGLTQGLLQIPFGMASDWLGRKRVIIFGLLVFALGSFIAMAAADLTWLTIGRSVQGAGAISAAVSALLADQTRDEVRTKAMTLVGVSIGLMFAVSLIIAPLLVAHIGLTGLFTLTGCFALTGIAVVIWWVPPEPAQPVHRPRGSLALVLRDPALLRLDMGVFVLHAVQLAMWIAIPALLVDQRHVQLAQIRVLSLHVADREADQFTIHVHHDGQALFNRMQVVGQGDDGVEGGRVDAGPAAKQGGGVALDLLQLEDICGESRPQQAVAHDAMDPCNAVKNRTASGPDLSASAESSMCTSR